MFDDGDGDTTISIDDLREVICRHNCSLHRLRLAYMQLVDSEDNANDTIAEKNSSVEELSITYASMTSTEAAKVFRLFDSLKQLDLSCNSVSDLSPLDPLLLGDRSKIEVLSLTSNNIAIQDFNIFLKKLPKMNSLKSLEVGDNSPASKSESCLTALKDAVCLNTSLEKVFYGQPKTPNIDSMIRLATSLNRGAKRKILDQYPVSLPRNLWSHVLKRATTIKYYDFYDEFGTPTLTSPRSDVVFWLLRKMVLS